MQGGETLFTGKGFYNGNTSVNNGAIFEVEGDLPDGTSVWIQPSGKYIVSSDDVIGALAGGGAVHLNSNLSIKFNDRSENNAFKGTLTGAGDLVKISGNVVTLRGGFEGDDGHTGRTRVEEGTLRVKGFLSDKTVSVAENAIYQVRSEIRLVRLKVLVRSNWTKNLR